MKKKYLIILLVLFIFVILTACDSWDDNEIKVNELVDNFQKALTYEDEEMMAEVTADQVKVTLIVEENSESRNYTPGELITDFKSLYAHPAHLFYNLNDKNISKIDDNTVVVYGKLYNYAFANLYYSYLLNNLPETGFNGRYFSADYPNNWLTRSYYDYEQEGADDSVYEFFISCPPERFITLYAYAGNYFALNDMTLTEHVDQITEDMNGMADEYPEIEKFEYSQFEKNIDEYDAIAVDFSYEHELAAGGITYPIMVEIKMEKENDNYFITEITESRKAANVETISIQNKMYFIRKDEKLYIASYGGDVEDYEGDEFEKIIDSYQILD